MDLLFYLLAIFFSLVIIVNIFSKKVTKKQKIKYTLYLVVIIITSIALLYATHNRTIVTETEIHDVITLKENDIDMSFSKPKTIVETKITYANWSFKSNKDTFSIKDQQ
jgi:cell division protein FtsL